jgi:hypothetical protein
VGVRSDWSEKKRERESFCVCVRKSVGRTDLRMFYLKWWPIRPMGGVERVASEGGTGG